MQTHIDVIQHDKQTSYTLLARRDGDDGWIGTTQESPRISSWAPTKEELLSTIGNAIRRQLERDQRQLSHQECNRIKKIVWTDKENLSQQKITLYTARSDRLARSDTLETGASTLGSILGYFPLDQKNSITVARGGIKSRPSIDSSLGLNHMLLGAAYEDPSEAKYMSEDILDLIEKWGALKTGLSTDPIQELSYAPSPGIRIVTIDKAYVDPFLGITPVPSPYLNRLPNLVPSTPHQKVLIAHGHDHEARDAVANFVKELGFTAIIFDEPPDKGETIIEKFRQGVGESSFAIVLMTPDDVGTSVKSMRDHKEKFLWLWHCAFLRKEITHRARQNVILELGLLLNGLEPERICILCKGKLEFPSNIQDLDYERMDDDGWKQKIIRQMMAAEILVERNNFRTYAINKIF